MQVFFTVVGANGSVVDVVTKAPAVFAFAAVHLAVVLGVGRLAGLDRKRLLIASNANVGGPTTAAAMATAKGWSSLVVPGILVGIFHLRDLHCHVPRHRLRHVRAPEDVQLLVSGFLSSPPARFF
jgi:uncharacterized membrane protein